jgi:hypothetical protein
MSSEWSACTIAPRLFKKHAQGPADREPGSGASHSTEARTRHSFSYLTARTLSSYILLLTRFVLGEIQQTIYKHNNVAPNQTAPSLPSSARSTTTPPDIATRHLIILAKCPLSHAHTTPSRGLGGLPTRRYSCQWTGCRCQSRTSVAWNLRYTSGCWAQSVCQGRSLGGVLLVFRFGGQMDQTRRCFDCTLEKQ